jgi:hypothetical protein
MPEAIGAAVVRIARARRWVDEAIEAGMDPQAIVQRDGSRFLYMRESDYQSDERYIIDELIHRGRVTYAEHPIGGMP